MIHCSQTSRSAKTKQHLEASRCILSANRSITASSKLDKTRWRHVFSNDLANLPWPFAKQKQRCYHYHWKTVFNSMTLSYFIQRDSLWHSTSCISAHLPNCSMSLQIPCTMAPAVSQPRARLWQLSSFTIYILTTSENYIHAEGNGRHKFLVPKLLKIRNQNLTLKASRRFTCLCEPLRKLPTI